MKRFLILLAKAQGSFINLIRVAIFVVMAWIGGLKAYQYEAEGIVPFVANSPFMSFFYTKQAPQYKEYQNKEGVLNVTNIAWHKANGTYLFSYGLGAVIVLIGILTLLGIWFPKIGILSGILTFGMALVTLSFLISTPEAYVASLGGPQAGFPFLSGAGRLVIKDVIMMAGGLIIASDAARKVLHYSSNSSF
jgi:reactive chlorine resistance protein C